MAAFVYFDIATICASFWSLRGFSPLSQRTYSQQLTTSLFKFAVLLMIATAPLFLAQRVQQGQRHRVGKDRKSHLFSCDGFERYPSTLVILIQFKEVIQEEHPRTHFYRIFLLLTALTGSFSKSSYRPFRTTVFKKGEHGVGFVY